VPPLPALLPPFAVIETAPPDTVPDAEERFPELLPDTTVATVYVMVLPPATAMLFEQ
jgi:hypothetical protein